jgi:hypothetical protein
VLGKFFGAKRDSADGQDTPQTAEPTSGEVGATENAEQVAVQEVAASVTPVATTTPAGTPAVGWATLGVVPMPQCVPAAPGQFIAAPGALSEVSAATVARLLGTTTSMPPAIEAEADAEAEKS